MHATSIDRWASWIHSNLGELRCQILPENMTKRKRWMEAAGQGLFNFWAHIRLWGTRARGRTPLPAAARVASIAFGTNGTGPIKRSFTCPPLPAKLREKRKVHERVVYVQYVQQKSATTAICPRRRAGPAIKPAGGSRPRTTAVRDGAPASRSRPPTPSRYAASIMHALVCVVEAAATAPSFPLRVARARGAPAVDQPSGRWF